MALGAVFSATSAGAAAQQAPIAAQANLKFTVVISRFQGEKAEKRIGSLPFVLSVGAGDSTSLRMQSEVPIPTTTFLKDTGRPETGTQYRPVGTSIDVRTQFQPETGRYRIYLAISDSQLFIADPTSPSTALRSGTVQSFTAQNWLSMRDGETIQYTAATDKMTGEVVKVDVTLNVMK
jgi:hypothetical protein